MDSEDIAGLRLIRTEGVGPMTYHGLIAKFGSAEDAIAAFPDIAPRLRGKQKPDLVSQATVEQELSRLSGQGGHVLTMSDPLYPPLLKQVTDAPPFLSVLGQPSHLTKPSIGIVGARNASLNGKKFAQNIARDLADAGYTVWSGLARGIDTAAHRGALQVSTVAVMAGGVDVIYPRQNSDLHGAITKQGALISEMPLGNEPQAHHFPRRNRLISGASAGVVVVEGTPKSGSLITARLALDQGREVFAVPGSPLDPRAEGPNTLIREGAALVRSADDILQELRPLSQSQVEHTEGQEQQSQAIENKEKIDTDSLRQVVLEEIGPSPVMVDELRRQCQVSAPELAAVLLDLELEGRIERLPGNRICGSGGV